ncbi:DUF3592 domain-containing protein [Chitinophaga sp. 212800010-3]|uniref:DUF3592 domain-containing protein n=1 Tax=unclassified Chitinophaga TaxID=2619133 RepID=UPI002DEE662D|nr:hypothetical protein [Chitinophaga sp. 212800010-3]
MENTIFISLLQTFANIRFDGLFFMLIGLTQLVFIYFYILAKHKRIRQHGVETTGTVSGHTTSGNIRYPLVKFQTADAAWVTEEYQYGTNFSRYKPDENVTVIYNRNNPKEFLIKSDYLPKILTVIFILLALSFFAIGLYTTIK